MRNYEIIENDIFLWVGTVWIRSWILNYDKVMNFIINF